MSQPGETRESAGAGSSRLQLLPLLGIALFTAVLAVSYVSATDPGDQLTRNTVRLSLGWYAIALCLMMRLSAADWAATTFAGRLARGCWTWALACFLVHFALAFHYFHHWSHATAFEHTRQVAGVGEGIYINYLFACVWIADVAFWWKWPNRCAARPAWIDCALHGFMLFIVFNSMVVFGTGVIRWAGVLMFAVLGIAAVAARRRKLGASGP